MDTSQRKYPSDFNVNPIPQAPVDNTPQSVDNNQNTLLNAGSFPLCTNFRHAM